MISDFTMTGTDVARKMLGEFRFQVVCHEWADQVEPILLAAIQRNAPVSKGPGSGRRGSGVRLRDSFSAQRHTSPVGVSIDFISRAPQAKWVLGGTRPHEIRPRNAKALYWVDRGGSHFARLVHHPGTKPNPFVRRAVRPLVPLLTARFEDTVARALRR